MRPLRLLVFLLAAWPALAQLKLYIIDPVEKIEHPVTASYDLGSLEVGAMQETPFRLRNPGPASIDLTVLNLSGSGFSMTSTATPPVRLVPGTYVDITVRFQPFTTGGHSASLTFNTTSILLVGKGLPGLRVFKDGAALTSGDTIEFGSTVAGTGVPRHFTIENRTTASLDTGAITVTGAGFRGPSGINAPLTLTPGQSAGFDVFWEPQDAGSTTGSLNVGRMHFYLHGSATEPPLPRPRVSINPSAPACAQQIKVTVQFDAPSPTSGTGQLKLTFTGSDPGLRFLTSAAFTVQKGESTARFGSATTIDLQTGTTAGTVTVAALLGPYDERISFQLGQSTVVADSIIGLRSASSIDLTVNGYDNTRTAGPLAFTFRDRSGSVLGGGAVHVDAGSTFTRYFDSANAGGLFTLRASFPVTGAISTIDSVDVEIANSAGTLKRNVKIAE